MPREQMFRRTEKPRGSDGPALDSMGNQITQRERKETKEKLQKDPEAWREQK